MWTAKIFGADRSAGDGIISRTLFDVLVHIVALNCALTKVQQIAA